MPLSLAAANGARSIVKALIAKGALPDRNDLIMNDLVATDTDDAGAAAKSSSNLSPLHFAVLAGHLDVVSDFVDWGRDVFAHAVDDDAKRPRYEAWQAQLVLALSIAIHRCHFDIAQFLVNAGVSPLSIDPLLHGGSPKGDSARHFVRADYRIGARHARFVRAVPVSALCRFFSCCRLSGDLSYFVPLGQWAGGVLAKDAAPEPTSRLVHFASSTIDRLPNLSEEDSLESHSGSL